MVALVGLLLFYSGGFLFTQFSNMHVPQHNQQKQQTGSASVTPFAKEKAAPAATGCCSRR